MSKATSDRNLLFGITSLQMDFISRDQLIDGMSLWASNKSKTLGGILLDQQHLTSRDHELIDQLVERQINKHGDPQKSLQVMQSIYELPKELQEIADDDIQQSLGNLSPIFFAHGTRSFSGLDPSAELTKRTVPK
jgi:hypothetical protein